MFQWTKKTINILQSTKGHPSFLSKERHLKWSIPIKSRKVGERWASTQRSYFRQRITKLSWRRISKTISKREMNISKRRNLLIIQRTPRILMKAKNWMKIILNLQIQRTRMREAARRKFRLRLRSLAKIWTTWVKLCAWDSKITILTILIEW